jgi:hypothetical protein
MSCGIGYARSLPTFSRASLDQDRRRGSLAELSFIDSNSRSKKSSTFRRFGVVKAKFLNEGSCDEHMGILVDDVKGKSTSIAAISGFDEP